MTFQSQVAPPPAVRTPLQPQTDRRLQRKCACGGTPGPTGECEQCKRKRLALQRKLAINEPGDRYEQEADRVAETITRGGIAGRNAISSLGRGSAVQREEPAKPKTEEEKYKEAAKKAGEAFLETAPGKEIKKKAEELGDAFISTLPGKVITGTAIAGAVTALAVTHKELPIGIPEIPLDKIKPGLKMKITYEGPVDKPTKVMATFSFSLGGGKSSEKKSKQTESEKFRAETARMAAEQTKFREGLKTPEEKAAEQRMFDAYIRSKMLGPGQLTPRTSPLSFGVAGEQLGFHSGVPAGARSWPGPWVPDSKLTGETTEEPKKKEEETLQRKSAGHDEISHAPPIVDEVLQSSGELLEPATRALMEERFGYDFGNVRIHRDARAADSARAVNAHAYTVGRDIVFNSNTFAPDTDSGRRLLVHELTHVVQQGATPQTVQRAVLPGLEVKGRETGTGEAGSWSVFFERNDATLDSDGELAVLFAGGGSGKKKNFDLHGHISEDEAPTPADGKKLANDRIKTVDAELKSIGHTGKRNPKPKPDVGDGRLDYRNVRSVEIAAAGKKSSTLNCKTTAATGPCSSAVKKKFGDTRKQAQGLIDKARRLLTSGTDAATNDLRDEFFGGAGGKGSGAAATKVLDENLGKIKGQMDLNAKPKHHRCGTLCDGACTIAIAYNEDVGNASVLTLCPGFVKRDPVDRTRNFIHETAHATPGLGLAGKTAGTTDIAYRFERRLPRLTPDQALRNSDSYALFVMLAAEPAFTRPKRPVDKLSVKSKEKSGVEDVLALLSDWVKWSNQETTNTYSTMVESRAKKKWTNSYYEETMKLIATQFGLTNPPKLPTDDDRFAVAGIVDRYETISNVVRKDLDVQRDPKTKTTTWSKGPGNSIKLGDDFFALKTTIERTRLIMTALVAQVSNILPAHRKKFVDLAEQINARNPLP